MAHDDRTVFGGRGGKGHITFGGEGSALERKQAGDLASRMMASIETQHDLTSETIESVAFVQEGRSSDGLLLSEMHIRFVSGATLHVTPGSDKAFLVNSDNPRREP